MTPLSTKGRSFSLPVGANFRKLLGAHAVSNLGDGISLVAYPWLASALTRNPILISGVLIAQRVPWLLFSLPVGVTVDRRDRRNLMVAADVGRACLTAIMVVLVWRNQRTLPPPDLLESAVADTLPEGRLLLFVALLLATFLLGAGEVLHDTSAATLLPQIVPKNQLPTANGWLSSTEQAANLFFGPPLGALLIAGAYTLPFAADAVTFAVSAITLASLRGVFTADSGHADPGPGAPAAKKRFRAEVKQGFTGLKSNRHVAAFAAVTTVINLGSGMVFAIMVFFSQEVLGGGALGYSALTIGSAVGSVAGGLSAAGLTQRFGLGTTLRAITPLMGASMIALGFATSWATGSLLLGLFALLLVVWVVHTTSFRQSVIPNELLGRVNGAYRFFSYGAIPIGAVLGGVVVAVTEPVWSRSAALRIPFVVAGVIQLIAAIFLVRTLSDEELTAALDDGGEGSAG